MRTLLITDDHESVLHTLDYVFTLRGYRTLLANSGAAALEIATKEKFDAALLDLHMPAMDGLVLCRTLLERATLAGGNIPIFIMTAAYLPAMAAKVSEAGAVALLKKPFDCDELLRDVERYCTGELPIPPMPPRTFPPPESAA